MFRTKGLSSPLIRWRNRKTVLNYFGNWACSYFTACWKGPRRSEEILYFPSVFPYPVWECVHECLCLCVVRVCFLPTHTHCQTQGNSIGSASRVSNTRSAQWGIHWEQWCWQWMGIMDFSDKLTNCLTSDLTSQSREIAVFSGVLWDVCRTIYKEQSEWRTDFPEWCFLCCWEEGRADRETSLSLINKPRRWSGGMPFDLINKRDTAYAFPHKLSSGLSEEMARRVTDTVAWMEDVLESWDSPRQILENLLLPTLQSTLLTGTVQNIYWL